ncbi:hypothetical protein IYX23_19785 [Methylocystis sp. L43]|jgi:hypothetical protein|nr:MULTISPECIES: hypothetical protein [unclassified Methylocystis]MBG0799905.1 hypothetical protein [Methylocystis sp. L43]MBG0807689.1 hypothetical protein [Methylocystis sp. H15]
MTPALAKRTNVWEQLRARLIEQSGPEVAMTNRLTANPRQRIIAKLGLV